MYLNIFELTPLIESVFELNDIDGLQYHLVPNKLTVMRLREDDFKGVPLFNFTHHRIGSYRNESGFQKRIEQG